MTRNGRRENMAEAPPGRRAQFDYGRDQYDDQYGRDQYPQERYPQNPYPPLGYPREQYGQDQYGHEQFAREPFDYPREQPAPMQPPPPVREQFEYGRGGGQSRKPKQRRRGKGLLVLLAIVVVLGGGAAAGVALGIPQLVLGDGNVPKVVGLTDNPEAGRGGGGTADGNWNILRGNATFVGYRVRERFANVPAPTDAVGRSPAVTGGMSIVGGKVVGAKVTADLRQLASNEGRRDQAIRGRGLETNRFPQAVFQLTQPVNLGQLSPGKVTTFNAIGTMTLHGVTRQVRWPVQGRWDGNTLQVAGNIPIRFANYGIQAPSVGGFVSVQPQGTMEFSLVMQRS